MPQRTTHAETLNRTRLLLAVPALLGAGCATIQRLEATETGRMLAAAGFHVVPRMRRSGRRIFGRGRRNVEYTYADPHNCHCV
jgi:hypothetical protein